MGCSYGMGVYSVSPEVYLEVTLAIRLEQAIIKVSMRLNNDSCRLDRGQGWEPRTLARLNRNSSLALPTEKTSTVDRLAIDPQMRLGFLGQVCISPIQGVLIYDVSKFANLYYTPSDGFSTHAAYPDGY
eukprot:4190237-Pleurochrysis_carterae.AAC.1